MSDTPPEVSSGVESKYGILSRTWELELLVSGAVFFALLQVPAGIDAIYARIEPHLSSETFQLGFFAYIYARAIVFVLIGAFLTHLASRAYWVGLVGLDSVFPNGIRWDKLSRYGPVGRSILRERLPTLPATIAAIDNFCSVIFGFAFVVVFMFLFSVCVVVLAFGLALVVSKVFPRVPVSAVFMPVFLALVFYSPALILIDKVFGNRLAPGSAHQRMLHRVVRYSFVGILAVTGAGMITLFSNVPRRVMRPLFIGVIMITLALVSVTAYLQRSSASAVGQWFIPTERAAATVDYQFYENRTAHADARSPAIQSDIITDPYVRLLIPYYARRDNNAIAQACPELNPRQLESAEGIDPNPLAVDAVFRCVAKLRDIRLDGATLSSQLQFYRDEKTGFNGFVTYIPTTAMTHGRHLITIKPAPREDDDPKSPPSPFRIWFWI